MGSFHPSPETLTGGWGGNPNKIRAVGTTVTWVALSTLHLQDQKVRTPPSRVDTAHFVLSRFKGRNKHPPPIPQDQFTVYNSQPTVIRSERIEMSPHPLALTRKVKGCRGQPEYLLTRTRVHIAALDLGVRAPAHSSTMGWPGAVACTVPTHVTPVACPAA